MSESKFKSTIEKNRAKAKKRANDPETKLKIIEKRRIYNQKNKEKLRKYNKEYRKNNKAKVKLWPSRVYQNVRDKQIQASKKYALKNKEKLRQSKRDHQKYRFLNDPMYKLKKNIRNLILQTFKTSGYKKRSKTSKILGCSFEEFKAHIESQFQQGMSWENRHLWHIDHIMPVSMAKTYDEVYRLNHYRNLRPLWAHENISKSDKTPEILVLF